MMGTANPTRREQIRVTACSDTVGLLTEGPRWIDDSGELMWVDILGSQLHRARIDPRGLLESPTTISIGRHVGAAAPVVGGGYLVAATTGFLFVDPRGAVRELAQPEAGRTDVRMNDGAGCALPNGAGRHGIGRTVFRIDGLDASGPACAPYRGQIPPS
jgi:sugar lactone lactonase YvrE